MATNVSSIGTASRDYSTLQAWESAVQGDLVTAGNIEKGEAYDDSDFTATITIDGSTTDASNYLWLTAAAGEEHDGTDANGVVISGASTYFISVQDPYTLVENFILKGGTSRHQFCKNASNCTFRNLISKDCDDNCFYCYSGATSTEYFNCISINTTKRGLYSTGGASVDWYNCLVYNTTSNPGYFVAASSTGNPTNCISMNNATADFSNSGTMNQSYNISSDGTASGTGSLTNRTATASASPGAGDWVIFTNITSGSEDFHLQDNTTDNDAQDAGTDDPGGYTLDIDLVERGTGWDIGPDQIVAAGGATLTINVSDCLQNEAMLV